MRGIDSELRESDTVAQVSGEYALNGGHVASGNRAGQRGVGKVRQAAHPLGGIDFIGMQAAARGVHQVERERVLGAELILEFAPQPRGKGG